MRVSDLEKTVDFYKEVFGLEVTRRHQSPRGSQLAFAVPNSDEEFELTYFPGSGPVEVQEDLMHLAFEVEDMNTFERTILNRLGMSLVTVRPKVLRVLLSLLWMRPKAMRWKSFKSLSNWFT